MKLLLLAVLLIYSIELCSNSVLPLTQCGKPSIEPDTMYRIVGGTEARGHSWPWTVFLISLMKIPLCGGSLINNQWILTAAHCFDKNTLTPKLVRVGEHNINPAIVERYEQDIPIDKVFRHPLYHDDGYDNDIALIKLDYPVAYNEHISPICLADEYDILRAGRICYSIGWGNILKTGADDSTVAHVNKDILQQVALPILPEDVCKDVAKYRKDYSRNMMCAGYMMGGKDPCQGDSGGPLVCQDRTGQWIQHGIVSWGIGCGVKNYPGFYTKVSNYMEWIVKTVEQNY